MTTDILGTHSGCWSKRVPESGSENLLKGGQHARCEELGGKRLGKKIQPSPQYMMIDDDHSDEPALQDNCI